MCNHFEKVRMDAGIIRELGVEGKSKQILLANPDNLVLIAAERRDIRTQFGDIGSANEDATHVSVS